MAEIFFTEPLRVVYFARIVTKNARNVQDFRKIKGKYVKSDTRQLPSHQLLRDWQS